MTHDNVNNPAGQIATLVDRSAKTVTMVPSHGAFGVERFKNKYQNQMILRSLCQDLPHIIIPGVHILEDTKAVIEEAAGVNLTTNETLSYGSNQEFLKISTRTKIDMVMDYLEVVRRANHDMRAIIDHKSDSLFIQPNGTLTIADCGEMEEIYTNLPFREEMAGTDEALINTLASFFSRSNPEFTPLIPAGIYSKFQFGGDFFASNKFPDGFMNDIKKYLDDRTPIDPQPPIQIGTEMVNIYQSGMSQVDFDVAVCEAWRKWEYSKIKS